MHCPYCQASDTKVIDSRVSEDGLQVRRRRECICCNERFTTYETVELTLPRIIKNNGTHATFDLDKLRMGIVKALEKRPVSVEQIDGAINRILKKLRAGGEREVATRFIGELVMEELRKLDQVAYVRFASVYRSFEDVNAFREEIQRLQEQDHHGE